jgi:hypothetical protein
MGDYQIIQTADPQLGKLPHQKIAVPVFPGVNHHGVVFGGEQHRVRAAYAENEQFERTRCMEILRLNGLIEKYE